MYPASQSDRPRNHHRNHRCPLLHPQAHRSLQGAQAVHPAPQVPSTPRSYDASFNKPNFKNLRTSRAVLLLPAVRERLESSDLALDFTL